MSFFDLSDNTSAATTGGEFEMGGGNIDPIPNNTDVLAAPDEAKWDSHKGDFHISIRWTVLAPKEYANRKISQKIRVEDTDPKKSDKAKRMLAAIDTNAGGKLVALGRKPTDQDLAIALINKPMVLKVMVWEMDKDDGSGKATGNWVAAVSPRKQGQGAPVAPAQPAQPSPAPPADFDDDIPF